jgi:hypothetical protein
LFIFSEYQFGLRAWGELADPPTHRVFDEMGSTMASAGTGLSSWNELRGGRSGFGLDFFKLHVSLNDFPKRQLQKGFAGSVLIRIDIDGRPGAALELMDPLGN